MDFLNTGLGRDFLHSLKRIADGLAGQRVDEHSWTKRDEIALKYYLDPANDVTLKSAYGVADRFLKGRKELLDDEKAARRGEQQKGGE
jgi:hypothetical protein